MSESTTQSVVVPVELLGRMKAQLWTVPIRSDVTLVRAMIDEALAAAPAPSSLAGGEALEVFAAETTDVQSRYVIVHQLRASADIQDGATRRETGWATTSDRAELMRRAADAIERLAALSPEAPAREGVAWSDIATAPEGVEVWGFRPAPEGMPALYGVIDLVQFEEEAWFDANGDQVTAPTLWAPTNKPSHPITGKPALTPRHEAPDDRHERNLTASNAELLEKALSHPPLEAPAEGAGEVREAIVTAIAFLNRDQGTDRLNDTVTAIMPMLVRADAILRGAV